MINSLPNFRISLSLIADVITYLNKNSKATSSAICSYTGKGSSYVSSAICAGRLLGIIGDKEGGIYEIDSYSNTLEVTAPKELKLNVMRKYLQDFEPFVTFIQFCSNGYSIDESARKTFVLYNFSNKDYLFLKSIFLSWGIETEIINEKSDAIMLNDDISIDLNRLKNNDLNLDNDMAIRLYISERLGADVFSTMKSAEIEELADAIKKYPTDPRGALECAGRAFEDFLRRISQIVRVEVSGKTGIGQIANSLYNNKDAGGTLINKIHSKHFSICSAIGDIRNMAGHSLEAKTMERWTLASKSSLMYVELVLSTVRSIYLYVDTLVYDF